MFVGRVVSDSGAGWGKGPARVSIEEPLFRTPAGVRELTIDTQAGSSCYFRLKQGERYVIYAWKDSQTGRLTTGVCSNSFLVKGHEVLLDAIRNLAKSGPSRIVGTVEKSTGRFEHDGGVAGATVTAKSGENIFEAKADAYGNYEFRGVPEGRYRLDVAQDGFVPDEEYNRRWTGRLVADEAKRLITPDRVDPGSIVVSEASCAVRDLAMWALGRISGVVRNQAGEPLKGAVVQAFEFDRKGKRESTPLRTAMSSGDGSYSLDRLPAADYVVGVNAEPYADRSPYPPTVYKARVHVGESQEVFAIDLKLAAPRSPAILRVTVVGPDGAPHPDAAIRLDDLNGQQRGWSRTERNPHGWAELPVYEGERFVVRALDYPLEGAARVDITAPRASVTIFLAEKP